MANVPLLSTHSQWRMYLIYMALCIIAEPIVYFYIPETTKVPVEEIGAMFGDEVVVHMTTDGHGLVEESVDSDVDSSRHGKKAPLGTLGNDKPDVVGAQYRQVQLDSEKSGAVHSTSVGV